MDYKQFYKGNVNFIAVTLKKWDEEVKLSMNNSYKQFTF